MVERYNEGKAIDAVIRRIETREKSSRLGDGWSPDDRQDTDKDRRVDYVCTVGKQLYAFEHTGIEPFPNQIKMQVDNQNLFAPVVASFDHQIPIGPFKFGNSGVRDPRVAQPKHHPAPPTFQM